MTDRQKTRPRTVSMKRMGKAELDRGRELYPETGYWRPTTRGECEEGLRPCPYVACKYHLYLDVHPKTGSIKLNFPDKEPGELEDSCALDVATRGGMTLEAAATFVNLSRERVCQMQHGVDRQLRLALAHWRGHTGDSDG